jgi:hypothetical protein
MAAGWLDIVAIVSDMSRACLAATFEMRCAGTTGRFRIMLSARAV